jgi:hypothetical protein
VPNMFSMYASRRYPFSIYSREFPDRCGREWRFNISSRSGRTDRASDVCAYSRHAKPSSTGPPVSKPSSVDSCTLSYPAPSFAYTCGPFTPQIECSGSPITIPFRSEYSVRLPATYLSDIWSRSTLSLFSHGHSSRCPTSPPRASTAPSVVLARHCSISHSITNFHVFCRAVI